MSASASTIQTGKAPAGFVLSSFRPSDRIRIQRDLIRERQYIVIGKLLSVVFETRRSSVGMSASRPRWSNSEQAKLMADAPAMHPFSEWQTKAWHSLTLDWLRNECAPVLAVSRDWQDLLLPFGLSPLPDIPDPRWTPEHAPSSCPVAKKGCARCIAPRIPQPYTGCPVVGDRVRDKVTARDGQVFGILHPITELCVMLPGERSGFGRIRGAVGFDHTHLSLMVSDSSAEGFFVGGRFQFGG